MIKRAVVFNVGVVVVIMMSRFRMISFVLFRWQTVLNFHNSMSVDQMD